MGAENDNFVTVRSTLDRVLIHNLIYHKFLWPETVLNTFPLINYHPS